MSALVALCGGIRGTVFAALALLLLAACGVQSYRLNTAQKALAIVARDAARLDAARADAVTQASESARLEEQTRARATNLVAKAYERGRRDAQAAADSTAADLRTGTVRFRQLWQECSAKPARGVSGVATGPGEPSGASERRADSTGRILRATGEDAAQVRCLQAIALTDRGLPVGDLSKGCPSLTP